MVLKIPNPLNSCESSMLHNHTSVGIIGDNTDIHWASLPYITPGNHGKKQDDMMKSGYHKQKEKTKRWYVYYNPTSTSNLIKTQTCKSNPQQSYTRSCNILQGSPQIDLIICSPKKPVCPKCSKQSLWKLHVSTQSFEFVVCLSHKKIADRTDFKHNFGMESLALSLQTSKHLNV